jgi:CRP/FNR family transcriptional regulator
VLGDRDLGVLDGAKVVNAYEPGQFIFHQGSPCVGLFCVESGIVAIRRSDEAGNVRLVRLAHGGQTLGYRAFFGDRVYSASAEPVEPVRVCQFDAAVVRDVMDRNPALALRFLNHLSRDLADAEAAALDDAALPVRARLARLLMTWRSRFGDVDDGGDIVIRIPISRQDIASVIGTRPETVTRCIRAMHDDGVALFTGRSARVRDLDRLLDEIELSD